jgi:diguanylate cyclase (GGDEF)-like protein
MAKPNATRDSNRAPDYILVAIVNTARASAVRNVALDFCTNVVLLRDGQSAIGHMDNVGAPRLLITELSLPRVDGFGVLRHLSRRAAGARSSAIAVSSHDSLRRAAMKLADSLGISQILPLDVDRAALKRAMAEAMSMKDAAAATPARRAPRVPAAAAADSASIDEVVHRALLDLTRQFHVPVAAAYLRVREERRFLTYGLAHDTSPSMDWSHILELWPHAASGDNPLLVPNLEHHPLVGNGAELTAIRGFAGVPLARPGGGHWGALGVFDNKALSLAPDDIDALAAFARDIAAEIDQQFGGSRDAASASEIDERFEALEQLAATDPLTGLANRRGCEKSSAAEISRAERERKPLSCIMLDIDRFKEVNDTMGHQAGDQVLRELSSMLRQSVRAYDIVARWGGEEFLVILPGADLAAARQLAERLRLAVQKLPTSTVTISAGAAEFDADYDFEATLRTADRRMYEAKAAGRDCVV